LRAFYDGIKHKPETTFGKVKADVLADKDPNVILIAYLWFQSAAWSTPIARR
jgi:hypothetical protein